VQRHGGIRIGDVLVAINDTNVSDLPFAAVQGLLQDENRLRKSLSFVSAAEYARHRGRRIDGGPSTTAVGGSRAAGITFRSAVRRGRVNRQSSSAYVEYEVVCSMAVVSGSVGREQVHRWSIWRRYSEFEHLDANMRRQLGWQMDKIVFPPKYTFSSGKLESEFIERRRRELDAYWQSILAIDRITDFNRHHCSADLKLFLEVTGQADLDGASGPRSSRDSAASARATEANMAMSAPGGLEERANGADEAPPSARSNGRQSTTRASIGTSDTRRLAASRRSVQARSVRGRGQRRSILQQRRSINLGRGGQAQASTTSPTGSNGGAAPAASAAAAPAPAAAAAPGAVPDTRPPPPPGPPPSRANGGASPLASSNGGAPAGQPPPPPPRKPAPPSPPAAAAAPAPPPARPAASPMAAGLLGQINAMRKE